MCGGQNAAVSAVGQRVILSVLAGRTAKPAGAGAAVRAMLRSLQILESDDVGMIGQS
jgi:hypothetical protein